MNELLNSNFLQTIVTAAAGLVGIYIYLKRRHDGKKDIANAIVLEIQNAERAIDKVKDATRRNNLDVDVSVMPSESWTANKQLFVRVFDRDEWDQVTEFYNKAALIDQALKYSREAFSNDVEQIRANKQRILADIALGVVDDIEENAQSVSAEDEQKYRNWVGMKASAFDDLYMQQQGVFAYVPQKHLEDVKLYLKDMPLLSTSSVGLKLKKIVRSKW